MNLARSYDIYQAVDSRHIHKTGHHFIYVSNDFFNPGYDAFYNRALYFWLRKDMTGMA